MSSEPPSNETNRCNNVSIRCNGDGGRGDGDGDDDDNGECEGDVEEDDGSCFGIGVFG